MSEEGKKTVCSVCGKEITPEDARKEWRKCQWCKKPMCFDCCKYIGVNVDGLYSNYIKVIRLCKKCHPEKDLTP